MKLEQPYHAELEKTKPTKWIAGDKSEAGYVRAAGKGFGNVAVSSATSDAPYELQLTLACLTVRARRQRRPHGAARRARPGPRDGRGVALEQGARVKLPSHCETVPLPSLFAPEHSLGVPCTFRSGFPHVLNTSIILALAVASTSVSLVKYICGSARRRRPCRANGSASARGGDCRRYPETAVLSSTCTRSASPLTSSHPAGKHARHASRTPLHLRPASPDAHTMRCFGSFAGPLPAKSSECGVGTDA